MKILYVHCTILVIAAIYIAKSYLWKCADRTINSTQKNIINTRADGDYAKKVAQECWLGRCGYFLRCSEVIFGNIRDIVKDFSNENSGKADRDTMDNYNARTGVKREKYIRFNGAIGFLVSYYERLTGSILYRQYLDLPAGSF